MYGFNVRLELLIGELPTVLDLLLRLFQRHALKYWNIGKKVIFHGAACKKCPVHTFFFKFKIIFFPYFHLNREFFAIRYFFYHFLCKNGFELIFGYQYVTIISIISLYDWKIFILLTSETWNKLRFHSGNVPILKMHSLVKRLNALVF